jgi:hypothetical protein
LHIPASIELTKLPKGAQGPFADQTPNALGGQRSTAQVWGQPNVPDRARQR